MEKTVAGARHLFGVGTVTRFHGMDPGDFVVLARDGVVSDLSLLWGVSKQRVRFLLAQGRVLGVEKDCETGQWLRSLRSQGIVSPSDLT